MNVSGIPVSRGPDSGGRADALSAAGSDKDMFLRLLVAQLKYQNPLQPADGLQFVTQLAQFTQLEQSAGMREDLAAIRAWLTAQDKTP